MSFSASSAHSNTDERVLDVQFSVDAISVSLRDARVISVPLVWYPRLLDATAAQRNNWKIAGGGYGIHWPDIDEDLSTEGLLRGAPAPCGPVPAGRRIEAIRSPASDLDSARTGGVPCPGLRFPLWPRGILHSKVCRRTRGTRQSCSQPRNSDSRFLGSCRRGTSCISCRP